MSRTSQRKGQQQQQQQRNDITNDDSMRRQQYERIKDVQMTFTTSSEQPYIYDDENNHPSRSKAGQFHNNTLYNFILMSILFSANHGCTVACLSLATARLGNVGAWQSGVLYLTYTASAVLGATYVVKQLGSRNALILGLGIYCAYIGSFLLATVWSDAETPIALLGAALGGIGGGFLWTAQGSYFGRASEEYAMAAQATTGDVVNQDADQLETNGSVGATSSLSDATSLLGGIFAFIYLAEEVILKLLSSILIHTWGVSWSWVFGIYTAVAIVSVFGMIFVKDYNNDDIVNANNTPQDHGENVEEGPSSTLVDDNNDQQRMTTESSSSSSTFHKVTAAWNLLRTDPKMKYMIGLNAVFGFSGAFLNSFVSGEVVRISLNDDDSSYVGVLSAVTAAVAAIMSMIFGKVSIRTGKGFVLTVGAISFFMLGFLFVVKPNVDSWGWTSLLLIYTFQGIGRATFESTLRATFADFFPKEKEGAFANIILQNGLSSTIGYFLSINLRCGKVGTYCIEFKDGTLHDVLTFELLVIVSAVVAILGYWRAEVLYKAEKRTELEAGEALLSNGTAEMT